MFRPARPGGRSRRARVVSVRGTKERLYPPHPLGNALAWFVVALQSESDGVSPTAQSIGCEESSS